LQAIHFFVLGGIGMCGIPLAIINNTSHVLFENTIHDAVLASSLTRKGTFNTGISQKTDQQLKQNQKESS